MLLFWMFISICNTIYFFTKKFIFPNVYISVNAIFECHYIFFDREREHQLSSYSTGEQTVGCHASRVRVHVHHLFLYFWQCFCLIVSSFFCGNLTVFKKGVFVRNDYFSKARSISIVSFSFLKLFLQTKSQPKRF